MKKIFVLLVSLFMIFTVCGCSSTQEEEDAGETIVNPVVEYDSLEEVNEIVGTFLVKPAVMGVSDEVYGVINNEIAQYQFSVNGIAYTFRASHITDEDISGVYSGEGYLLDSMDSDGYASDDDGKIMQWYYQMGDVGTTYVLYANDKGALDEATFKDIANELLQATVDATDEAEYAKNLYALLDGVWYDEYSQRASATITNNGDNVTIDVHWGDSYNTYTSWTMTATYSNGSLVYSDCVQKNVTLNDDGVAESEEVVYENGSGSFTVDGKARLLWDGAQDESCMECIFVKDEA